ncbi:MAG: hypothetical protein GXO41_00225 [Gammaproteobacteria bacterium]|jgi:hypothetical protein|nr:hypothetical protein [Gammaproteobacteria bacterium]NPA77258.1 hypothetical protein [Gammaproteobacteria bacterium]
MTKKLFYLILTTTIVLFVALKADNLLAQRRINNLIYLINTYQNTNKKLPNSLADLNKNFNGNDSKESYCDMFEPELKGIGYCYYTNYKTGYAIQTYSYFYVVTFESENNYLTKKLLLFSTGAN